MILRLSVLLYILPPVLFAWYLQATPSPDSSSHSLLSRLLTRLHFSSSTTADERQPLMRLMNSDDPFSYDWSHLFQQQQQQQQQQQEEGQQQQRGSYYSKMNKIMMMETTKIDDKSSTTTTTTTAPTTTIHVIVLIHGWLGNPLEMDSIKESLIDSVGKKTETSDQKPPSSSSISEFVVHAATCNDGKTTDGIDAGGKRLAGEINSLLRYVVQDNPDASSITLSVCGNSLGGLYARRALADIEWNVAVDSSSGSINENSKENDVKNNKDSLSTPTISSSSSTTPITPLLFVTTATPHLGVSQHTYIRLPRAVEYPIAQILDQTGRDLFRFSNVLEEMTFDDSYIQPLQRFQQRIAYANVYGTDFQVPTPTAAFWALDSDSPHEVVDVAETNNDDTKTNSSTPPDTIVLTLKTPQRPIPPNNNYYDKQHSEQDPTKRFQEWSQQLDRLGWTKVLVDVREHVPQVSMWRFSSSSTNSLSSSSNNADDASTGSSSNKSFSNQQLWTADELLKEFGAGLLATVAMGFSGKMRIPLGHTVMVANAKDNLNKRLTVGGKPVMDWLAASMIQTLNRSSGQVEAAQLQQKE